MRHLAYHPEHGDVKKGVDCLRAILADDEDVARGFLREMLAAHPEIEIVAECNNGFDTVKTVNELRPDLLFLDVQMPKLDGFEVLELLDQRPAVIFVTAFDQYAMRAFDAHAVDYLLKPFGRDRFERALARARETAPEARSIAAAARESRLRPQRIVVRDGAKIHVIPIDKLDYAEAQDDYVSLHSEGKSYLKQQPIAELEAMLDPARFVRIHRSYLVNIERIARVEPYAKDSRVAVLRDGAQLAVSRTGYARLMEAFGDSQGSRNSTR